MKRFQSYAKGRLRRPAGAPNKLETAYGDYLETLRLAGQVVWFMFEAVKLRLADLTFYTPDYFLMTSDGTLEVHEVKGYWEDDARVKIKVAADKYPFKFTAVKREKGLWIFEEF